MGNIELVLSLFNQYLFQEAKNNIVDLEYHFRTNAQTSGNQLVEELINAVKTYDFAAIDQPLFMAILNKCGKNQAEIAQFMSDLIQYKMYTREQIQPAAKYLRDVCAATVMKRAEHLYGNSPTEYIKYIKNSNFNTGEMDMFSSTSFSKIDINSIIAESTNSAIPTNVRFINDAFYPLGGIERGQIGIICAPPGVGKTLEAMNLACHMASIGEKVLYVSCADMNWKDFIVRIGAIAFGISFSDSYKNLASVYESLKKTLGDNLEISINAAGAVSADDIVQKVMADNFSVVVVDYDGVLNGVTEGDSMYNSFGEVYNTLTKLSIAGKLVLVCSQPKVTAYDRVINLADIGESSKKQQVVDWIWTISNPNQDCPNHLYVMNLPKARRGKVGSRCYVIRIEGKFIEIPKGLYDQLRTITEEKHYTEPEILQMVDDYNRHFQAVRLTQPQSNAQPGPGNNIRTPF